MLNVEERCTTLISKLTKISDIARTQEPSIAKLVTKWSAEVLQKYAHFKMSPTDMCEGALAAFLYEKEENADSFLRMLGWGDSYKEK